MRECEPYSSLREMLLHYAKRRGWRTQRRIATACDIEETALSRFLNGEQDLGARRTHALFRAVGIPADDYDLAYDLLARLQEQGRAFRDARLQRTAQPPSIPLADNRDSGALASVGRSMEPQSNMAIRGVAVTVRYLPPDADLPMDEVLPCSGRNSTQASKSQPSLAIEFPATSWFGHAGLGASPPSGVG